MALCIRTQREVIANLALTFTDRTDTVLDKGGCKPSGARDERDKIRVESDLTVELGISLLVQSARKAKSILHRINLLPCRMTILLVCLPDGDLCSLPPTKVSMWRPTLCGYAPRGLLYTEISAATVPSGAKGPLVWT